MFSLAKQATKIYTAKNRLEVNNVNKNKTLIRIKS